jgi:hypothetical protein
MGFSQAPEPFQLLRMIRVDSQQQTTGGIKLFFPPTIQADAVGMNTCLHLKPGWQGGFCLRQPLGEELFFNRRGDTIQIRTQAALGQPWTLIRDSTGLQIQATLTALGTTAVDGVPDSFRTATLQAYRNGAVVPHAYNGRTLRWSKAHGWLQTLDWYSFPYGARYGFYAGALDDSADYQRLSKTIPFYQGLSDTDVLRKYTPGNEWVFKTNSGNTLNPMASFSYQSDSVIATRRVGNQLLAEIRYQIRLGSQSSGSQSSTLQSGIRTDTIALGQPIVSYPQLIRPDIPDTALLRVGDPVFQPSYFADTLCGGTLRIRTRPC